MTEITVRDRREAEKWVLRMLDDPERHRPALSRWMLAKPGRRQLYERFYSSVEDATQAASANPVRIDAPSPQMRQRRWPLPAAALLAGLLCLSAFFIWQLRARPEAARRNVIASGSGELLKRTLGAGVSLTLDADSRVTVETSSGRQTIALQQGRMRLAVPARAAEGLVVRVAQARLATAGGIFDVSVRNRLAIGMRAGTVIVHGSSWRDTAGYQRPVRLRAGQQLSFARAGATPAVSRYRPADDPWAERLTSFEDVPISAILNQANRHSATKIFLADPALGDRRIFGDIRVLDARAAAGAVAAYLGGEVDASMPGRLIIRT